MLIHIELLKNKKIDTDYILGEHRESDVIPGRNSRGTFVIRVRGANLREQGIARTDLV